MESDYNSTTFIVISVISLITFLVMVTFTIYDNKHKIEQMNIMFEDNTYCSGLEILYEKCLKNTLKSDDMKVDYCMNKVTFYKDRCVNEKQFMG